MEVKIKEIAKRIVSSRSVERDIASRYNHFDKYRGYTDSFTWETYLDSLRLSRDKFERFMNEQFGDEQVASSSIYAQYTTFIEAIEMATDHSRIHIVTNPIVAALQEGHIAVNRFANAPKELSHFMVINVIDNGVEILDLYTNEISILDIDMIPGTWEIRMHSYNIIKGQA